MRASRCESVELALRMRAGRVDSESRQLIGGGVNIFFQMRSPPLAGEVKFCAGPSLRSPAVARQHRLTER